MGLAIDENGNVSPGDRCLHDSEEIRVGDLAWWAGSNHQLVKVRLMDAPEGQFSEEREPSVYCVVQVTRQNIPQHRAATAPWSWKDQGSYSSNRLNEATLEALKTLKTYLYQTRFVGGEVKEDL